MDAAAGVTPADIEVANLLRKSQRKEGDQFLPPILLVVNKADSGKLRNTVNQFYELGMGDPFAISALHGIGVGDLLDAVLAAFPEETEEVEDEFVKVAIVGKPNVGKSSLLTDCSAKNVPLSVRLPGLPGMRLIPNWNTKGNRLH